MLKTHERIEGVQSFVGLAVFAPEPCLIMIHALSDFHMFCSSLLALAVEHATRGGIANHSIDPPHIIA